MKILKTSFLFLIFIIGNNAAQASCDDGASLRSFKGPNKTTQSLWKSLKKTGVPTWEKGSFHAQEFNYIGLIQSNRPLHVVWFYTEWGVSTCRGTSRLLLFSKSGKFFGSYTGVDQPSRIIKSTLHFSTKEPVDFSSGPPDWLQSENIETASEWALTTQSRGPP